MIKADLIWDFAPEPTVATALLDLVPGQHFLAASLARRGIRTIAQGQAFLDPGKYTPTPPESFEDMTIAISLIQHAIENDQLIGVWGDFDVDGQTSTALLVSALTSAKARVCYHIPIRKYESHGIGLSFLKPFLAQDVKLLITCDTGITAHEAVDYCKTKGIPVIITDHHILPEVLPKAAAIINPHLLPENNPLQHLSGVGVAYKLAEGLLKTYSALESATPQLWDLVALGTVADLAILQGENRYLVQKGLQELRHSPRTGIKAILEIIKVAPEDLTEEHISFFIAPRMNALGRLGDANPIIEFLLSQDPQKTRVLALILEQLNGERKLLCDQVFQAAMALLEKDDLDLEKLPFILLSHPTWPTGVIGIAASRLVEVFHKPVLLVSRGNDGIAHGSARSVEDIHITQILASCKEILNSFGGHAMAAGFSLTESKLAEFQQILNRTFKNLDTPALHQPRIFLENFLTLGEISNDLAEQINLLAPFGTGNPNLIFASTNLKVTSHRTFDRGKENLELHLKDEKNNTMKAIWWHGSDQEIPDDDFDLAYSIKITSQEGKPKIHLEWLDCRPTAAKDEARERKPRFVLQDFRSDTNPIMALQHLSTMPDTIIWQEGESGFEKLGADRYHLQPAAILIIAFTPPSFEVLRRALNAVKPRIISVFNDQPKIKYLKELLEQVTGMLKYAMNHYGGSIHISDICGVTGTTEQMAKAILEYLKSNRVIFAFGKGNGRYQIKYASPDSDSQSDECKDRKILDHLWDEIMAYQNAFRKQDLEKLLNLD